MTTETVRLDALVRRLIAELNAGADDPMWSDHCEITKRLAKEAAESLVALQAELASLRKAVEPFAKLHNETSGRIPVERLSFYNWHTLAKAFKSRPDCRANEIDNECVNCGMPVPPGCAGTFVDDVEGCDLNKTPNAV